tara:strand:+ start:6302 stop:8299 length:1998 start_codon:yes stop_codon:yes gene_type:complete
MRDPVDRCALFIIDIDLNNMDDDDDAAFDNRLAELRGESNPLASSSIAADDDAAVASPETFASDEGLRGVWGTESIAKADLATLVRDTVLEPTSSPHQLEKYLLSMEFIYMDRRDVLFLFHNVYMPIDQIVTTTSRIEMNIACLDMCCPENYVGTSLEHLDIPHYTDRINKLAKLTIQVANMARLFLAYGTDNSPELVDHTVVDRSDREQSPSQKLLNFLLQKAGDQRLRRKGTAFYRPRCLVDGTHTGFYEYYCEITDFMFRVVSPARSYPEEYDALTNKPSTPDQMVRLLGGIVDPRCPFLVKSRTQFSFANGIFDVADGTFTGYRDRRGQQQSTSNFFDCVVPPEFLTMAPIDIPTPNFNKILLDQQFDAPARRWMYILCGRLLHDVGTLDDWQVSLYIRGVAGSGKSTILKTMGMMYEQGDVGYMMSDGQATFSDEHLFEKNIVMAMDLDRKTTFSATRINSMTSGEKVSINRKFKTALNEKWKPPMILASNAQPPWPDVAGNLMRRFPIFTFNHSVRNSDPTLFDKLRVEVPALLIKMGRLYLEAVRDHGHQSLWADGVLPTMCHTAKRQYLVNSNPLSAFLESDHILLQEDAEVDTAEFRRVLSQYTKEHGDRRSSTIGAINRVDHGHLFAMYGCTLVERPTGNGMTRTSICGMTLIET